MHAAHPSPVGLAALSDAVVRATAGAAKGLEPLARSLLDWRAGEAVGPGRSIVNHDGSPVQLCLSVSRRGLRVRLIGDPAYWVSDPVQRYRRALAAARTVVLRHAPDAGVALGLLLEMAAPPEPAGCSDGVLWLAGGVGAPAFAVYLDVTPHAPQRAWGLAQEWLAAVLPEATQALGMVAALEPVASLVSLGIEGGPGVPLRAKLYWRMQRPMALRDCGPALFADPGFAGFVTHCLTGGQALRVAGLTLGAGFRMNDGALHDVKADLCCCPACLRRSRAQWQHPLFRLGEQLALDVAPLREALDCPAVVPALVGLGLDSAAAPRLNLYLKDARRDRDGETRLALEAAVAGLVDCQEHDGHWWDYALPVGPSDQWITAYVGLALAEAAAAGIAGAAAAACRAGRWLTDRRTYREGWGYSAITGPDADSTAHAVLLLGSTGQGAPEESLGWLESLWRSGGGFATYPRRDAWGDGHPCITGPVYLALHRAGRRRLRTPVVTYLRRTQRADGLWPAYWWRGCFYAGYANLLLARALGEADLLREPHHGAVPSYDLTSVLDIACMAGIETLRGRGPAVLFRELVERQGSDGLWSGGYDLRVTEPDCRQPWIEARGLYYRDQRGLLTSAISVRALAGLIQDTARNVST